jgi:uncharacterized protein
MRRFFITFALFVLASPAAAASFDCAKARAPDEKAVCASRRLSELDVKMATLYQVDTRLVAMGQRGDLQDAQVLWLTRRARCGRNIACIESAYQDRLAELQKAFDAIASHGPF